MAVQTLMQMPDVIECGDTLRVQLGFGNYPPGSYSAALKFNIAGTAPTSVTGTAATSTDFLFVLSAADGHNHVPSEPWRNADKIHG
jgi:hypothetical protein